ncbi:MAG: hypothetical protein BRD55_10035 [Bacteroidetes bacterium SW_9_63_38]|nr:MAG: hypothetical protein BRD55_10035 [Bacteroidetes bacterium SW_9_63_38]
MRNDILATIPKSISGLIAVYQFGATADGTEHTESDLDLAVLARRALPISTKNEPGFSRTCRNGDVFMADDVAPTDT